MKITCMIVEDEPVSQDILRRYIENLDSLDLIAVCNDAIEAAHKLSSLRPDVLFLDITMPRLSGLDFYRSLINPPHVIFTTAYPEYAVNGFEVNAVDYLVKPFAFDRFVKAINRLQDILKGSGESDLSFIVLQADKKLHKVVVDDILYLEAMGDYVKVFLREKTLIVHQTLQRLLEQLPQQVFFRVHKSYVISLTKLEYVEGNQITIANRQVPIGQTFRTDFLTALHKQPLSKKVS
ncbi:MAG TPA: response regulator transcription factor [Chryseosolibacter sp.]